MKLYCTAVVSNRLHSSLAMKSSKKSSKSTVALCKQPNQDKYCMILFTGPDKTGTKYELTGNIEKVLTKFINEGKSTIQFKNPPHDLYLTADIIALKAFLHLLKRILNKSIAPNELTCQSLSVTPYKNMAPTRLKITSRSEYPTKGFSRTIEYLTMTNLRSATFDRGILRLSHLKLLDLSDNAISKLPEELSNMCNLQVLILRNNQLHNSRLYEWKWINGNLAKSLHTLDLSNNKLRFLPEHIIKLQSLISLDVRENELEKLPSSIGHLKKLQDLNASHNKLKSLPGSIIKLTIRSIEISDNEFEYDPRTLSAFVAKFLPPAPLRDIAAQKVSNLRLHYDASIIPATLVDFLDYDARYCVCGKPCFTVSMHGFSVLRLRNFAQTIICRVHNPDGEANYSAECYFCSMACTKLWPMKRPHLMR